MAGTLAAALAAILAISNPTAVASRTGERWMVSGWNMQLIQQQDAHIAAYFFDTPNAFGIGTGPEEYHDVPTRKWASFAEFRSAINGGTIDPSIKAVAYDPEHWAQTPLIEQQHPKWYMHLFSQLANAYGYIASMNPARDLMGVEGAVCRAESGESYTHAFIRCNIAGEAARYANVYRIQSQALEDHLRAYGRFVGATLDQARTANPDVIVLGGLSTSAVPGVTAQMLYDAWAATHDIVNGYYVTISSSAVPTVAVPFFRMVKQSD